MLAKDRMNVDRRITMHEVCRELDMDYGKVQRKRKDELHMSGVSTRLGY